MNTFNLKDVFRENHPNSRVLLGEGEIQINKLGLIFFKILESLLATCMILLVKFENSHDRSDHSQVIYLVKPGNFKKSMVSS